MNNNLDEYVSRTYKMDALTYPTYRDLLMKGQLCSSFRFAWQEGEMFTSYRSKETEKKITRIRKDIEKETNESDRLVFAFYAKSFMPEGRIIGSKGDVITVYYFDRLEVYFAKTFSVDSFIIDYEQVDSIYIYVVKVPLSGLVTYADIKMNDGTEHKFQTNGSQFQFIRMKLIIASMNKQLQRRLFLDETSLVSEDRCYSSFSQLVSTSVEGLMNKINDLYRLSQTQRDQMSVVSERILVNGRSEKYMESDHLSIVKILEPFTSLYLMQNCKRIVETGSEGEKAMFISTVYAFHNIASLDFEIINVDSWDEFVDGLEIQLDAIANKISAMKPEYELIFLSRKGAINNLRKLGRILSDRQ